MRIGFNPNKDKKIEASEYFHQVIIPVYIPNEEGYFKDSFQILKYCLESLFKTSHNKTFFTIVNNGSCKKVVTYLNELFDNKIIHELIHTSNIGKLNAILKGLTGHSFELITITDADVLFLNGWQKATYEVYETFAKTGVVSTTPNSKLIRYFTSNIFFDKGLSKSVKFSNVINQDALKLFADSVGNPKLFNDINLNKYLTIKFNSISAVIGAGHFVATYRREVFENLNLKVSPYSLGGNSEELFLDKSVVNKGFWRLSTSNNYTYHMGNILERWMVDKLESLKDEKISLDGPKLLIHKTFKIVNYIKNIIFPKLIFNSVVWRYFLRIKGLSKCESSRY
jgi:hypothetical protein